MQPTPMLVTDRAYARSAPSIGAADLGRYAAQVICGGSNHKVIC